MSEDKSGNDNPFHPRPDQYFDGYNESIEQNFGKNQKEALDLQRITFQTFDNSTAQDWIKAMKEQYLRQMCEIDMSANNSDLLVAGFRAALLVLLQIEQTVKTYKLFIENN